jgi:hypothetical protein
MKRHIMALMFSVFCTSLLCRPVLAHVGAINLFVDPENRIFPLETFQIPQLVEFLGIEISTDGPGFGVNFPTQGVQIGSDFSIDVAFDLLYWDGAGVAATPSSITMEAPTFDNQGSVLNSPVPFYTISGSSGYQAGMTWGTYNGANFWEAHGLNFLGPLTSEPGIYGAVFRVHNSAHESSHPFVVPFVYDPNETWDPPGEQVGIDRLRAAATAIRYADLNLDGLVDTDDVDALVTEIVSGTHSPDFDLTDDQLVDGEDLEEWLVQAATVNLPLGTSPFLPGDANLDGVVDGLDFIVWNGSKFTSVAAWSKGDFNADGIVDGLDFITWNDHKFTTSEDLVVGVPEPSPFVLLLVALAILPRRMPAPYFS